MNSIKAHITHITTDSGCALVSAECIFGTFYVLIIESLGFKLQDEVCISFKENEVFLLDNAAPLGSFNAFRGRLLTCEKSSLFTRISLLPLPSNQSCNHCAPAIQTPIYALIPSLKPLHLQEGEIYTWCVSSSHIILEDSHQ